MNINDYNKVVDRLTPSEQCREEILNEAVKKTVKLKVNKKTTAIIVSAVLAACCGTTVFAAKYSNLFKNLEDNKSKTWIDDEGREWLLDKTPDPNNYEMLESVAETVAVPDKTNNNELSVSIESTYCDGRTLVLGLVGNMINRNADGWDVITFNSITIDCGDVVFKMFDYSNQSWLMGNMMLEEGAENSFSGQITLNILDEYIITEPKDAVITLEYTGFEPPYEQSTLVLKHRIVPDTALINNKSLEQSEDGYKVKLYNYSPSFIHADWEYPKEYDIINENESIIIDGDEAPKYAFEAHFYDENDNEIFFHPFSTITELNKQTGNLTTPATDIVTVRILNLQEKSGSDLYFGKTVYKEFVFDISELRND